MWVQPWVGKTPGGANGYPLNYFLPGEPHVQRSLVGCSPWVAESDMTE